MEEYNQLVNAVNRSQKKMKKWSSAISTNAFITIAITKTKRNNNFSSEKSGQIRQYLVFPMFSFFAQMQTHAIINKLNICNAHWFSYNESNKFVIRAQSFYLWPWKIANEWSFWIITSTIAMMEPFRKRVEIQFKNNSKLISKLY